MDLPTYEDRYVVVNGKRIRYWAEGEGPAVILVHGLACSAEFWQYNVASLSKQYQVHAPDLPGFGFSDKQVDDFSLSYSASFLSGYMDALDIERATLVGNSMGGLICAQAAVQFPQLLDRLILVGSAGFGVELNPLLRLWSVALVGDLVFRVYQRSFPALKRWVFRDSSSIHGEWLKRAAAALRMPGVRENTLRVARIGVDLGLAENEKKTLHQIARTVIENRVRNKPVPEFEASSERLSEKRGAFVSLHKKGQLRGCIGNIRGNRPLFQTVAEMAAEAAFNDPRFPPVSEKELKDLDIEISAMTPLKQIDNVEEIEVGKHGIYIEKGFLSGLLLPQVATEYGWDRTTFLEHTCHKAGLQKDAWKEKDTRIQIFSADVF